MKQEIKIFLGGGVALLEGSKSNRGYRPLVVDPAISKLNSRRKTQRVYIVRTFTDLIHEYTPEGQQKHYHQFVEKEADIALFIFDGRVGNQTKEEIECACDSYKKHQHPCVFFYGTNLADNDEISTYLSSKKQYFQCFKNKEHLFHLIQEDLSSWIKPSLLTRWWHEAKLLIISILGCLLLGLLILLLNKNCSNIMADAEKQNQTYSSESSYNSSKESIAKISSASLDNALHKSQTTTLTRDQKSNTITFSIRGIAFDMVYVSGGSFTMGATTEQGNNSGNAEKPTHIVSLSDYYIGKYEVTQELWQEVMGSNPSCFKDANKPIEEISWDDCQIFIEKLNELLASQLGNKCFSLPTEAQWEYAARGGNKSEGYKYAGSNDINDVAWYDINSKRTTHAVGTKEPNELGLYDMSGNVKEWCQDWYDDYTDEEQTNPTGATFASNRVYRGGSWRDNMSHCRVSNRICHYSPSFHYNFLGMRLCLLP